MSMEYRGMSSSSVQGQEIQNRTLLLLQAIIALCLWALVALMSWRWIFDVRDTLVSQGVGYIERSELVAAGSVIALSVILLALAISRFHSFMQAPRQGTEE